MFRESDGVYVKDLSKLGRDLKRVIILDNVKENFTLQKDNGIFIKTWLNDEEDTVLMDVIPLLKQIIIEKVPDVRVSLRKYRDLVMRTIQVNKIQQFHGLKFVNPNAVDDNKSVSKMTTVSPQSTNNNFF